MRNPTHMGVPSLRRHSSKRSGVALLLVLWLIIILSLIAYSLIFQITLEASMTSARKKMLEAETAARAGVAKGIIDLRNDMLYDASDEEGKIFDAEGDLWAKPEEGKDEVELIRDGPYYNARVFDEESLFNINRFSGQNMILLKEILGEIGVAEEDRELIASSIIDWMDGDTVPVLPTSPDGDEGIAYALLDGERRRERVQADEVEPLVLRNEFYLTVDELLEVYGVTPELYFGPDSPEAAYYRERYPERWNFELELDPPRRRGRDEERSLGLRDYFTVYGSGKLNINTAPSHVLAAYARAAGQTDGDSFAQSVIRSRRGGSSDRNIDNDSAFKSQEDLVSREFSGVLAVGQNLYPVDVRSTVFRIISEGYSGEVSTRFELLVLREQVTLTRDETFESIDRARERKERNSARWERRANKENDLEFQYPMIAVIESHRS